MLVYANLLWAGCARLRFVLRTYKYSRFPSGDPVPSWLSARRKPRIPLMEIRSRAPNSQGPRRLSTACQSAIYKYMGWQCLTRSIKQWDFRRARGGQLPWRSLLKMVPFAKVAALDPCQPKAARFLSAHGPNGMSCELPQISQLRGSSSRGPADKGRCFSKWRKIQPVILKSCVRTTKKCQASTKYPEGHLSSFLKNRLSEMIMVYILHYADYV